MKILIVSGFLGAGKTTFIQELARHTGREFAILENEYGSVGVDGDRLKEQMTMGDVNIWEMAEGCICCSMKGDFAASVLTIANSVDPEYLVIEPTGVGMLSNIIRNLQQIEYERISLLAPITIADGQNFLSCSREYPELYRDQIASARTVIVSKMEQAGAEEKEYLRKELQKWNPEGRILTEHYSGMSKREWESLLEQAYDGTVLTAPDPADAAALLDTFAIRSVPMESPEKLFMMLERLIRGEFGAIVRAKGQIRAGGQLFSFDVAGGQYCVTGQETGGEGKAVFIGRDIRRQKLRSYFLRRAPRVKGAIK